jgi:Domain of unknown function (DUF4382)
MFPKTEGIYFRLALLSLTAAALVAAGCGSGSMTPTTQSASAPTGPSFVIGTDAPLAGVVSFTTSVTVTATPTGGGTPVTLTSGRNVDFARYNGLQTLLDENDVTAGSYDSISITLGSGTIGYLNIPSSGAPTIGTMTASYPSGSNPVSITLPNPYVVPTTGAPAGIRIDFDLAKSIAVDSSGAITGTVTPTFNVSTVKNSDNAAHIDEFVGGVITPPTCTGEPCTFTIQGPHGEQFTIDTTSSTEWDGSATPTELNANSVVAVAGQLDVADQTMDADEVAILTDSKFYAAGLVTYVAPPTGEATSMDFYVRSVLPSGLADVPLGGIAQVDVSGKESYGIYWMHNAFTDLLFNSYALTPGQEIAVGGTDAEATPATGTAITVNRIHLQNWGYNGTIDAGSQNSGQGSFTMTVNGFAGQVVPSKVTVFLGPQCDFRYGLGAFSDLTDGSSIRVVGLLLKNTTNGDLVLLARHVDGSNFEDFATFAF